MTKYKVNEHPNIIGTVANVKYAQTSRRNLDCSKIGKVENIHEINGSCEMFECNGFHNGDRMRELDSICSRINSVEMKDNNVPCSDSYLNDDTGSEQEVCHFEHILPEIAFKQDKDGDTHLHMAIILQQICAAMHFIKYAPSFTVLSICNYLFQSPLHLATLINNSLLVRRLVVGGANVEVRDKDGNTPLHIACRDGLYDIAQALIEPVKYLETKQNLYEIPYKRIPQDFAITNYDGFTCLHLAAMNGHIHLVKALYEKGIDINLKEAKTGRTILHNACVSGDLELVELLLQYKSCNFNAKAYDERTPYDLARIRNHELICTEMAAAGASYGDYVDDDPV